MSDTLLPCPFCGCKAVFDEVTDEDSPDFGGHFVRCTRCLGSVGLQFANKEDPRPGLTEKWNRRVGSKQEGADAALGEPKASEHPSSERRRGLEEAAKWHDQRARDTPDAFEMEFHQVSAKAIRSLSTS